MQKLYNIYTYEAEAQYSFRLKKTIIPLVMQKGYHNVTGWLGIIMGVKIFIDFTKYPFEESVRRLKKEINSVIGQKSEPQQPPVTQVVSKPEPLKPAEPQSASLQPILKPVPIQPSINQTILKPDLLQCSELQQPPVTEVTSKPEPLQWSEAEVNNWFAEAKLNNSFIYQKLYPCSGELLTQLYQIQLHSPEFFFKSITTNDSKDLKDLANFSVLLKKLFN